MSGYVYGTRFSAVKHRDLLLFLSIEFVSTRVYRARCRASLQLCACYFGLSVFGFRPRAGRSAITVSSSTLAGVQFDQWTTSRRGAPVAKSATLISRHDFPSRLIMGNGPSLTGLRGVFLGLRTYTCVASWALGGK